MSEQPLYERDETPQPETAAQTEKKQPKNKWTAFFVAIGILAVIFFIAFFGFDGTGGVASQRNANNVEVIDIAGEIAESGSTIRTTSPSCCSSIRQAALFMRATKHIWR